MILIYVNVLLFRVHSKRVISPSEGHFVVKTFIAAILKGRSKLEVIKTATLKGPSE